MIPFQVLVVLSSTGAAVSNVLIEDVAIVSKDGKPTVQVNFYMPRTRHGVCNNVTVRGIRSEGSWADGLNVHGDVFVRGAVHVRAHVCMDRMSCVSV